MSNGLALDNELYPKDWKHYIGQDKAKRLLQIKAKSALVRRAPLDHILIQGKSGYGKTALALLVGKETRRPVKVVSGKMDVMQARVTLYDMQPGDVLFMDEFHRIVEGGRGRAEWLLNYLQDGVILGPLGAESAPAVTVIGATTDAGKLQPTLLTRFLRVQLEDYSLEQATRIAKVMAKTLFEGCGLAMPSTRNCVMVAEAANSNPRLVGEILKALRDIAIVDSPRRYDVIEALCFLGITPDGLEPVAQDYLTVLLGEFGGSAGERAMVTRLQEPGGLGQIEKVLMEKGLIAKTNSGRVLTKDGITRARRLLNEKEGAY